MTDDTETVDDMCTHPEMPDVSNEPLDLDEASMQHALDVLDSINNERMWEF